MEPPRVLRRDDRIFTLDKEEGRSVYGEPIIEFEGKLYREWIPWRSKMGALLKKTDDAELPRGDILYLGAAQGTTVSHFSDILQNGTIYAVEFSPVAFRKLSSLSKRRGNIIPILADAFHPERYQSVVPSLEMIYQDVSQKDQVGLLVRNTSIFLKEKGTAILMLKARSIDVTASPERVYEKAAGELKEAGMSVTSVTDLSPFQMDHAAIRMISP